MNYKMKSSYLQINFEERVKIEYLLNDCLFNISKIANILKRSKSSIKREIDRNISKGKYIAKEAHKLYLKRFTSKHKNPEEKYPIFSKLFLEYFDKKWHGVEATWTRIRIEEPDIEVPSIKQTFNIINSNKWVIKKKDRLRRKYTKGNKRSFGYFSKFNTKYILPIWTRKRSINTREEFGHWEIDLVIGRKINGSRALLTLTERKTRMTIIVPIKSKNPHILNATLYKAIKQYNLLVRSITSDNGLEFKALGLFGYQTGIDIYKCNPYASHERGTNENANGLIRREYPKKTDFNDVTDEQIETLMDNINNMPRKIFNFNSAIQEYMQELSNVIVDDVMNEIFQKGIEKRKKKTSRRHGYLYMKNFI